MIRRETNLNAVILDDCAVELCVQRCKNLPRISECSNRGSLFVSCFCIFIQEFNFGLGGLNTKQSIGLMLMCWILHQH